MKLSIITINYNNKQGLFKTLESVCQQKFDDFEHIIIDGASTDGSVEVMLEYKRRSTRKVVSISEPDRGIYNAMNKGIGLATGEWLLFLNSGDELYDNSILYTTWTSTYEEDIVYGNVVVSDEEGAQMFVSFDSELQFSQLFFESIAHNCSFIKKKLFNNMMYNEQNDIVSDWEFFIRQALLGAKYRHIDKTIAIFYSGGISSRNRQQVLAERKCVIDKYVPPCIQVDMIRLSYYKQILADGQLLRINDFRRRNKFCHQLVTLFVKLISI